MHILVAADLTEVKSLAESYLESGGHTTEFVDNGLAALDMLKSGKFDLILSDVLLPGMDGFSLCSEVRKTPGSSRIPFIFLTATFTDPGDEETAMKSGAVKYLALPIEKDDLLREIKNAADTIPAAGPVLSDSADYGNPEETKTEETKKYNADLVRTIENRLVRKAMEFEDVKLLAETANSSKSSFLSNMSHELRTPLNTIIGFSEALTEGIYGELKAEHREYIGYILKSGMKLLSLINEVLELSKIEAGGMELDYTECSIRDVINSAQHMFIEKAKKHGISIAVEIEEDIGTFIVDQLKVKQIIVNLLANAFKSTPDDGSVLVSVRTAKGIRGQGLGVNEKKLIPSPQPPTTAGKDFIEISVVDSGKCLSEDDMENIFQPFHHVESVSDGKKDKAGLGLSLSKRFVELHHGRIWIESPVFSPLPGSKGENAAGIPYGNRSIFVLPRRS